LSFKKVVPVFPDAVQVNFNGSIVLSVMTAFNILPNVPLSYNILVPVQLVPANFNGLIVLFVIKLLDT
jgi:hypothetical protein